MAAPSEKLAESLEVLRTLQEQGVVAIRSRDLSRTHRERLRRSGFLREVIKGWYIASRPDEDEGDSTAWYTSFWRFSAVYLNSRFGEDWSLSPEQSLALLAGNWTVPAQLLVRAKRTRNNVTPLPFGTSLLDVRAELPGRNDTIIRYGLRLFSLPAALLACAPSSYRQHPNDIRATLATLQDASEILERLLQGGHSTIAGRLAGALRDIGRETLANAIVQTMRSAGYQVRENNPFETPSPLMFAGKERSPYVHRTRFMWQSMREVIIDAFPAAPGIPADKASYLKQMEDAYASDAYHSLSIEGYRVSPKLIERVRSGEWSPDTDDGDGNHRNALAARGYWQAFQSVKRSVEKILDGQNAGTVAEQDYGTWYRELFAPSVTAGTLRPGDLAGWRNSPVYIRRSKHVPPHSEAVRDLMPTLFELLQKESEPAVRVVLGHFLFVYIHPYMDGNGRIGRFLMNTMLASGGYAWTVIPVEQRDSYMAALESASVNQEVEPFARFLARLVEGGFR